MRPPGTTGARAGAAERAGTGLQAIVTSPQRKLALIDGKVVELGDASNVVLTYPGVEKKPSRSREREPGTR